MNPKFVHTIGLEPMRRLLERHRESLEHFDHQLLDGEDRGARAALEAFFAGPQDQCPDGPICTGSPTSAPCMGSAILGQAIRMSIDIPPEGAPDDDLSRQDPKQMAARVLICTEN